MEEIWKAVIGYEGRYEVSNKGRIKRLLRVVVGRNKHVYSIKEAFLIPSRDKDGYLVCKLRNGMTRKQLRVHRIVAEAFIPNPNQYPEINHRNEIVSDNSVYNLEWCNSKYNTNYGTGIYRRSLSIRKRIYQCTFDGTVISVYPSVSEESRQLKISKGNISSCLTGRIKSTSGYYFTYATP